MTETINILATVPRLLAEMVERRDHDLVTFRDGSILGFKDKTDEDNVFVVTTETLNSWSVGPLQLMFVRDLFEGELPVDRLVATLELAENTLALNELESED